MQLWFLFITVWYHVIKIVHNLFILSVADISVLFHFGSIMNKAPMNILSVSFGTHAHTFALGIYLEVKLPVLTVCICWAKMFSTFPKWLYQFTLPLTVYESSSCFTSQWYLLMLVFKILVITKKCVVEFKSDFNLHTPDSLWRWVFLHAFVGHFEYPLEWNIYSISCLFFLIGSALFFLLICSSLHMLGYSPLQAICVANIFSHCVVCILTYLCLLMDGNF